MKKDLICNPNHGAIVPFVKSLTIASNFAAKVLEVCKMESWELQATAETILVAGWDQIAASAVATAIYVTTKVKSMTATRTQVIGTGAKLPVSLVSALDRAIAAAQQQEVGAALKRPKRAAKK